jgi:hypothetical protein
MRFNLTDLNYAVQCQRPNQQWFDTIAAFDLKCIADDYALNCQKTNPTFVYRVVSK